MTRNTRLTPGTWTVEPAHSRVSFLVRHLMISKVRGTFSTFSGTVEIPDDPLRAHVTAEVVVASVNTKDAARDRHLRDEFFDVQHHPTWSFESTELRRND